MRLLHTSDWHLGRSFHREGMLGHQAGYIDHLLEVVERERVDVVLVAGDVYDRALPPVDAVALADAIMLLRLDPGLSRASLVSLPRDLYVMIHRNGIPVREEKLASALLVGGMELGAPTLVETVTNEFGVPIHNFVIIDFLGKLDNGNHADTEHDEIGRQEQRERVERLPARLHQLIVHLPAVVSTLQPARSTLLLLLAPAPSSA